MGKKIDEIKPEDNVPVFNSYIAKRLANLGYKIVDININKNPSNKNYTLIHYFKNEEGLQKDINLLTQGLKNSRLKGDKNENLQIKKDTV